MGSPITLSHLTLSDLERSTLRSLRFRSLISLKGAELGHMLLLKINRKPYMGSPMTRSHLTLSDLERSMSRSLRYQRLISRKVAELGHVLLPISTPIGNRISGSPKTPSYLTLSDFERSKLRSLGFRSLRTRRFRIWSIIDKCIVRYCVRVYS